MESTVIVFLTLGIIAAATVIAAAIWNTWTGRTNRYDKLIDQDMSDYSSLNTLPEIDTTPVPRMRSPQARTQARTFL